MDYREKHSKVILPVTYPTLTSWTWHANLFAIIEALPQAQDWIYSNYIQVQCRPDGRREGRLFFEFFPFYNSLTACPVLHTQYIDRKLIRDNWESMEAFLKYALDNGYYIYGYCNEKYVLDLPSDYYHELFVYGYDFAEKKFCCADFSFSNSRKYAFAQLPFELVCKGFVGVPKEEDFLFRGEGGILLVKVKPLEECYYRLDLDYLKQNLQEY